MKECLNSKMKNEKGSIILCSLMKIIKKSSFWFYAVGDDEHSLAITFYNLTFSTIIYWRNESWKILAYVQMA